ncbi:MAG: hypothetical protein K2X59_12900 [Sphingomonas sp.]|nr:hypothetical protein [Sphingomonas sp.]
MTDPDNVSRQRYFMMTAARLAGAGGAAFGVVLLGRAHSLGPQILGVAIVLSSMAMMALVPRALAARWRTPPQP